VNEAIPGPDLRLLHQPPAFAPVVRLSRAALAANVRGAIERGEGTIVDVRRDGCGHGAAFVAATAIAAGAAGVRADADQDPAGLGVDPALVRTDGAAAIDPAAVYGLPGSDGMLRGRPVMSLVGRVLLVKRLRAGEGVSYGYTFRAAADTRVALVTGGYGQGIVRSLGNRVAVGVGEHRLPIAGRVAMDVCMLDVGEAAVARGDEVRFFGDPADGYPVVTEWVKASGFGALEITCAVGRSGTALEEAA
jgi:alanine racemase